MDFPTYEEARAPGYRVRLIRDSRNAANGKRLTTFELTYPRLIHSEFMTHRMFSRNAASSRAIPVNKMMERVKTQPALPVFWGKNQKGMQAREEVDAATKEEAIQWWLKGRDYALEITSNLHRLDIHKQVSNRPLEPYMFITTVCTATDFENFWHQRDDSEAQPEFEWLAKAMKTVHDRNEPEMVPVGGWHLPYVGAEDIEAAPRSPFALPRISTARCARVSYLTQDGKRDVAVDLELAERLVATHDSGRPGHYSPFEHVAQATDTPELPSGNFSGGWQQFRKMFPKENITERRK